MMNADRFYFSSWIRNETKVKGQLKKILTRLEVLSMLFTTGADPGFPRVGRQPIIWPKFPKTMKCRKLH